MPETTGSARLQGIIIGAIIVFVIVGFYELFQMYPAPKPLSVDFTSNICDNAYQTEKDYSRENPPYIDVVLKPHCFSGFVHIPTVWREWQDQFLGNDHTDWQAHWWDGSPNYHGPFTYDQIASHNDPNVPSYRERLEGKGTLRLYRILPAGDEHSTDQPSAAGVPTDTNPRAGPAAVTHEEDVYDIELWPCRRAAAATECYGLIRSHYTQTVWPRFAIFSVQDDSGNEYEVQSFKINADWLTAASSEPFEFQVDGVLPTSKTISIKFTINYSNNSMHSFVLLIPYKQKDGP